MNTVKSDYNGHLRVHQEFSMRTRLSVFIVQLMCTNIVKVIEIYYKKYFVVHIKL